MSRQSNGNGINFIDQTSSIVSAYLSNHSVAAVEIPALIAQVHAAISRTVNGHGEHNGAGKPVVGIGKSIMDNYIVCLEDGKKFKSLKRHLRASYNLTPEQYRIRWGLPDSYPMVAPNYSAARSKLAKRMGLGTTARRG